MSFCLFVEFSASERLNAGDEEKLSSSLRGLRGLERGLVHTPATAHDPFLHDGAPPVLALQLYYADVADLEAAVARGGPLGACVANIPALAAASVTHEAMLVRRFPVPEPAIAGEPWCTYLVAYDGPAEDPNAWHAHYLEHHPTIMARFPGLRELELYTGIDWVGFAPGERMRHLQRNKVAFDSPQALTAALESPLRAEMREDYRRFPKFGGKVTHFPMLTRSLRA